MIPKIIFYCRRQGLQKIVTIHRKLINSWIHMAL